LIGETVNFARSICTASGGSQVVVSKDTLHFLELYTNNYQFDKNTIIIPEQGKTTVFNVSVLKGRAKADKTQTSHAIKSFDGQLQNEKGKGLPEKGLGLVNDSDDFGDASIS
jgi:hypothetical protein